MGDKNNTTNQFNILAEVRNWKNAYESYAKKPERAEAEEGTGGERVNHEQNILTMITSFENFCLEYINEISDLADPQKSNIPQDWLTSTADFSLLEYWEPILRAAEQYQTPHYRKMLDGGYKELAAFKKKLQENAFIEANTPIILYFEKVGKYKRYPFGNIYLIGVPLLDAYNKDWWAVPHELGHHIYWNSSFSENNQSTFLYRGVNFFDQEIGESIKTLKAGALEKRKIRDMLEAWTEEIFADVIGAKVAGKGFVKAAWQKIFRRVEKAENLFVSDKDHPIPYFLPYIRAYAIGSRLIDDKSNWGRFGEAPLHLANGVRIENLNYSLKKYVNGMNSKLESIRFENWVRNSSALNQLKAFIGIDRRAEKTEEFIKLLLRPRIIEEGEGWKCINGHTNNSGVWPCAVCGAWFPSLQQD